MRKQRFEKTTEDTLIEKILVQIKKDRSGNPTKKQQVLKIQKEKKEIE